MAKKTKIDNPFVSDPQHMGEMTVRQLVDLVNTSEFPKGLDTRICIGDVEGNNGVNPTICVTAHKPGDVVLSIDPHEGDEEYEAVDETGKAGSMKPEDAVPMSKELRKDENHVALICKAFIYDGKWYDGTNMYAKRQHVWERTLEDLKGNDVKCYAFDKGPYDKDSKRLFMPTDAEIQAALDEFKKKGWHAQYDSDVGYYAVFEGTRALGEYQARYTRNLF